ncbi:aspartate carbamoyltransferase regulatory subunit [Peptoniphilus sp. GNH]|nr:aspartate carbamoyltransferase regulatory chain, allosteric domain protein [Clostridiales bacterium KA00134]UHR02355.1 aspartate carbamoyltransferase regulatory subunit [Peptoniphilus sp. GNH]
MLSITSIRRGIVIDHIKPGKGYEIFKLLKLDTADYTVALIMNADSKKYGKKDMIKIQNVIDLDLNVLGVLDDQLTINIIEDEKIAEKIEIETPKSFTGVFKCKNPRCISSVERDIPHVFDLIDAKNKIYKCRYCDHLLEVSKND